jgi:hypothetical protein
MALNTAPKPGLKSFTPTQTKERFSLWQSKAWYAFLLLLLVNYLLVVTNPFKSVDPDSLPTLKSWVFWTKQDYEHLSPKAEIVLLGSSLLMNSVWMQEAEHLQKDVDIVTNRRTEYLESVLKKALKNYSGPAFNFGLPGSMLSDDYMIERTCFTPQRSPKIAVLCLGPRDLMDTSFSCAGATCHFKYLERFTDTKDLLAIAYTSAWPKVNFLLREWIYSVNKKYHAQISMGEWLKQLSLELFSGFCAPSSFNTKTDFDKQFAFYKTEVEKGVFIAKPNSQTDSFYDNGHDWKKRFKNSNAEMYRNQMQWFELALKDLQKKGIATVIVNMPVSELGAKYIPTQVYQRHLTSLQNMATKYNCLYIDTMQLGKFDMKDFSDYGHMDASGGKKVLDIIGSQMAASPKMQAVLREGSTDAVQ